MPLFLLQIIIKYIFLLHSVVLTYRKKIHCSLYPCIIWYCLVMIVARLFCVSNTRKNKEVTTFYSSIWMVITYKASILWSTRKKYILIHSVIIQSVNDSKSMHSMLMFLIGFVYKFINQQNHSTISIIQYTLMSILCVDVDG